MSHIPAPRFSTALAVEAYKLRRSLALLLAVVAPLLIAVFLFFNRLRIGKPAPWEMLLQSAFGIWAFFMLPMSVTALTALVAHTEHGPRTWDALRALPVPRWHVHAAKACCVLGVVAAMSVWLVVLTCIAGEAAHWFKPAVVATGSPGFAQQFLLLGRIFLSCWLLVAVQLWIALRYASFVPALAAGLGDRLMFGSDQMVWPESITLAIEGVDSAAFLSPAQKRAIFHDNAARFLGLPAAVPAPATAD